MAVFSFEWISGYGPTPVAASLGGELTINEPASSQFKKGYPLVNDTSASDGTTLVLQAAPTDDTFFWMATADGRNLSAAGAIADVPIQLRPGDILSVSLASGGSNVATTVDHIGDRGGWLASIESGETNKAVLDLAESTQEQFLIVGFDDRDAIGTSGGRVKVMYLGVYDEDAIASS